jgi:hypothetical protein
MRKAGAIAVFILTTLLVTVSCQRGPDACDEGGALFADDFEGDQNCGWVTYNRGGAAVAIEEGALTLTTSQPGQIWWTNAQRDFDDVVVSAEAQLVRGPEDNAFGLICRYQSSENFYVFLISSDGYYAIGKYQSGSDQIEYLTGDGQYVPADAIQTGTSQNTIRATCIGSELTLTVNGVLLDSVEDPTFVTGDIGMAASTFEPGTLVVSFDNVRVLAP